MEYAFQFSQVLAGIGRKRLITKPVYRFKFEQITD